MGLKLTIRQSYLAMFNFLVKCYQDTKDDCLGSLLGGFNPDLFVDSMSADPAAWGDWKNAAKKITDKELLTTDEAFRATQVFIKFHQEEFGFDLSWVLNKLDSISANSEDWLASIREALNGAT